MRDLHEVGWGRQAVLARGLPGLLVSLRLVTFLPGVQYPAGLDMHLCFLLPVPQEAAVMARMRHPNVVQFMGLCRLPPALLTGKEGEALRAAALALCDASC